MNRFLISFLLLILVSCTKNNKIMTHKIEFPESLELYSFDYQNSFAGLNSNLKILASYDSIMCGPCSIKRLIAWREMIEYAEKTNDLSIIFVFSPSKKDHVEMISMIKNNPVDYPLYYDINNEFGHLNSLPVGLFVCLLDRNDSIILSGSPFVPEVWNQYKKTIENYIDHN